MGSPSAHEPPPFNLTEVDRQVLSQTDEEFVYHDWENLKDIIGKRDNDFCLLEEIAFYKTSSHCLPLIPFSPLLCFSPQSDLPTSHGLHLCFFCRLPTSLAMPYRI